MISWKSKLKVLFPSLAIEFVFMVFFGYLSTLGQPTILKTLEEDIAIAIELVMCFEIAIIFFSFNYKEKQGVLQQVTFTMEQIFQIVFTNYYRRAVDLDKKESKHEV